MLALAGCLAIQTLAPSITRDLTMNFDCDFCGVGWVSRSQKNLFEKRHRDVSCILFTYWCHKCLLGPKTAATSPLPKVKKRFILVVPRLLHGKKLMPGVVNVVWPQQHHPGHQVILIFFDDDAQPGHRPLSFCITCVKMLSFVSWIEQN